MKKFLKNLIGLKPQKYMTINMMNNLNDDEIEFKLFDAVLERIGNDYDEEFEIITSLPDGIRYFYATWLLELEVNNGGFNQYFFNSASQFLQDAYEGLTYFSANEFLDLLKDAIKVYDTEIELHETVKLEGTIEAFSKSYDETNLNSIDKKFYKLGNLLSDKRVEFIRSNLEEFEF